MYGKPAMTYFNYQVHMYGSQAITYLNAFFEWLQSQHYESSESPPFPTTESPPPPPRMVA